MTEIQQPSSSHPGALEGRVFRPATPAELAEAIELAFDYRGDVTLGLTTGESLECYLFNRERVDGEAWVEVFPQDVPTPRRIAHREIASIAFTGQDTANGNSWEAWVSKKASQRKVESDRVEAEARARGHL